MGKIKKRKKEKQNPISRAQLSMHTVVCQPLLHLWGVEGTTASLGEIDEGLQINIGNGTNIRGGRGGLRCFFRRVSQ
jgi:hypothetical protein